MMGVIGMIHSIGLLLLATIAHGPTGVVDGLGLLGRIGSTIGGPAGSNQWFKEGLSFGCTGCGRCCKMNGDVWLSPEEQPAIAKAIGETVDSFRDKYTRQTLKEWACLKQGTAVATSTDTSNTSTDTTTSTETETIKTGCVFLSSETGQCTIYETRPVQCRTYPFWPSLLEDIEDWEDEAVVPDDHHVNDATDASLSSLDNDLTIDLKRYWSLEDGGCEGINHKDAPVVPADEIEMKRREARAHWRRFPDRKIKHDTWYL
jgi:Fe-S-cluster containining protein